MWTAQSGLVLEPLKAAFASEQSQLVEALICLLLLLDIQPHGSFVVFNRRHPITTRILKSLPELSNSGSLPGTAGGSPIHLESAVHSQN